MRVNIYAEEITEDVQQIVKTADTGARYHALRFYMESSPKLHLRPDDDDRSAVTFWGNRHSLRALFEQALATLEKP